MRLIGLERLGGIISVDSDTNIWVSAWVAEVSNANWRSGIELVDAFPRVKCLDETSYEFPVCGSDNLNIKVTFCFNRGIAVIREVMNK
ncbi:hypothetical protein GCM10007906_10750 [Vibrio hyugaensis]|uniref:Uncharacterized protein n=1 Tax=Vibrio hyugaensis TaxID=1534743 RepID=A0ABQ5XZ45_9VIBR|nr:type II toxin-antitoxin system HigB family toxin [Vibrio hyugaensis]GLR03488.1 hypothetical protein GCM10007906_10750 [Vibrio hyugaensis]